MVRIPHTSLQLASVTTKAHPHCDVTTYTSHSDICCPNMPPVLLSAFHLPLPFNTFDPEPYVCLYLTFVLCSYLLQLQL